MKSVLIFRLRLRTEFRTEDRDNFLAFWKYYGLKRFNNVLEMWESVVETRQKRRMFKFFMMVLSISVGRLSQGTKRRSFIVLTYFDIAHSKQVFQ